LIGVVSSALRLENVSSNITNIVIGGLLVLSVISSPLFAWAARLRPKRTAKTPRTSQPSGRPDAGESQGTAPHDHQDSGTCRIRRSGVGGERGLDRRRQRRRRWRFRR